ncbi:hypothetical protein BDD12DRAFT_795406 [Trichophaea hybrida]|nr:hypothetical protein BDD12DRAFT_795406 [Trichophaea hybrida]
MDSTAPGSSQARGSTSKIVVSRTGLTNLSSQPQGSSPPTVDIVAVHGLNSHPQHCWEKDGVFWLRDFLATSLPEARVMTFGYNANVINDAAQTRIRGHAQSLLQNLRDERVEQNKRRPLIFVCHSLGGIVVKQVYLLFSRLNIYAYSRYSYRYADIRKSTYGICFLGTPHRGANVAGWGKLLVNMSKPAFKNPKTQLLDTLRSQSNELLDLALDFGNLVPQLQIVSCIEQKETSIKKWGVQWKRIMVSPVFFQQHAEATSPSTSSVRLRVLT